VCGKRCRWREQEGLLNRRPLAQASPQRRARLHSAIGGRNIMQEREMLEHWRMASPE
jgi:hypothetical protein